MEKDIMKRQSATKSLTIDDLRSIYEKGSTTIPQGSRLLDYLKVETPDIIFQNVFNNCYIQQSCIYIFINTKTFNCYIGSTKNLQKRLRKHRSSLRYKHWNYKFQKIKEHRFSFYYAVLEYNSKDLLEARELYFLNLFKNQFNDILLNISLDTRRNFGTGGLWEQKIAQRNREISRAIYCYDLKGKFIKKYISISLAARELKITRSNIKKCIRQEIGYLKQYTFRDFQKKTISLRKSHRGEIALRNIDAMKKKVKCLENNTIYESMSEAQRQLNIPPGTLWGYIQDHKIYKNKYTFQYYKDIV